MEFIRKSQLTGKMNLRDISVSHSQYRAWVDAADNDPKRFVQEAFPHLSADDREFLKSGITPEEWDEHIGPEE